MGDDDDNLYVPRNMPAIGDLFDPFNLIATTKTAVMIVIRTHA